MSSGLGSDTHGKATTKVLADAMSGISRQLDELNLAVQSLIEGATSDDPRSGQVMALLIRAQAAAAALAASIQVISTFASGGLPRLDLSIPRPMAPIHGEPFEKVSQGKPVLPPPTAAVEERIETAATPPPAVAPPEEPQLEVVHLPSVEVEVSEPAVAAAEPLAVQEAFDIARLPAEEQELHRKAQKFARVAVQDILLYKREQVNQGRKNKDLYERLKDEIDKSREIYERRFARIAHHAVDHFYNEVLSVLAEGDPTALGHYPYPSPTVRR